MARSTPGSTSALPACLLRKFAAYCWRKPESPPFPEQLSASQAATSSASRSRPRTRSCTKPSKEFRKLRLRGKELRRQGERLRTSRKYIECRLAPFRNVLDRRGCDCRSLGSSRILRELCG